MAKGNIDMKTEFWDRVAQSKHDPAIVMRVIHLEYNFNKAREAANNENDRTRVYSAGGHADQALKHYHNLPGPRTKHASHTGHQ